MSADSPTKFSDKNVAQVEELGDTRARLVGYHQIHLPNTGPALERGNRQRGENVAASQLKGDGCKAKN